MGQVRQGFGANQTVASCTELGLPRSEIPGAAGTLGKFMQIAGQPGTKGNLSQWKKETVGVKARSSIHIHAATVGNGWAMFGMF